jgi:hypothetical protein
MSDYTSNYPAVYAEVTSVEDRDAIPESQRVLGMIVLVRGVESGDTIPRYGSEAAYQLIGGLGNTYWKPYIQPPILVGSTS